MYREERCTHNVAHASSMSITTVEGALDSPVKGLFNAPSTVINGPLVEKIGGDPVRIEGADVPMENVSTHLQ